jgi:hypothetical protein
VIVILASLKEFRFSEEYLQTLQQILNELHIAIDGFIETENNQAAPNVQLILERLQAGIGRMDEIASFHLDNDPISRYSVKVLARFLSTVFKFLESYEKLDQHSIRKIRQSLHEFLVPKGMIYSAELYLFFKAKKFLGLIDSVIERNMNIGEAKVSLLKFILEVDFLMLPKRVFISMRSPQLFVCQKFLWQLKDENKLSSLKEHIIETELEVKYIKEAELRDWSIECDLVAKDTLFFNTKFKKQAIKSAKNLISFQFLVTFESICKHKLDMTIKLINRCGLLMDKIELEGEIDII